MPRRISRRFHLPLFIELYNVQFFQLKTRYLWQSARAIAYEPLNTVIPAFAGIQWPKSSVSLRK